MHSMAYQSMTLKDFEEASYFLNFHQNTALQECQNFTKVVNNLDICYEFQAKMNQIIPNPNGGLKLKLNLEQYDMFEDQSSDFYYNGFAIEVRHPTTSSSVRYDYIPVFPNELTFIELNRKKTVLIDKENGGDCDENLKLRLYPIYSSASCIAECQVIATEQKCKCLSSNDPRIQSEEEQSSRVCSNAANITCQLSIENERFCPICNTPACTTYNYQPNVIKLPQTWRIVKQHIFQAEKQCLQNHNISSTTFFTLHSKNFSIISKFNNKCLTRYNWKENFVPIEIYYKTMQTTVSRQMRKETIYDLISSVGGTMGIYTGMSLISLTEIIDYLILRFTNLFS
ncbi:hypothetical protein SNEBB_008082 [Seison nebaliae]|nr:hypothetical protein SNEBB_008082 [Seison nebaliae]